MLSYNDIMIYTNYIKTSYNNSLIYLSSKTHHIAKILPGYFIALFVLFSCHCIFVAVLYHSSRSLTKMEYSRKALVNMVLGMASLMHQQVSHWITMVMCLSQTGVILEYRYVTMCWSCLLLIRGRQL